MNTYYVNYVIHNTAWVEASSPEEAKALIETTEYLSLDPLTYAVFLIDSVEEA